MYRDGRNPYGSKGGYVRDRYDGDDFDYEMDGRRRDYSYDMRGRDYHKKSASYDDMKHWSKSLVEDMEDKYRQFFKMESITAKAEDMGIKFDKFDPFELYVTVLMMFSDYKDALNTANVDIYIKLAKAWLCDEDAALRYGDKLHAYYTYIVDGEF
jgi:hypothetical protein